jgi:hypothetical protein
MVVAKGNGQGRRVEYTIHSRDITYASREGIHLKKKNALVLPINE